MEFSVQNVGNLGSNPSDPTFLSKFRATLKQVFVNFFVWRYGNMSKGKSARAQTMKRKKRKRHDEYSEAYPELSDDELDLLQTQEIDADDKG